MDKVVRTFIEYSKATHIVTSAVVFLYGLFFVIAGAYFAATYASQTEEAGFIVAIVAGGLLLTLGALGGIAVRKRTPPWFYAHMVLCVALFFIELGLLIFLVTTFQRIQFVAGVSYSANITDASTQAVSDYVNGLFVECCSGCTLAVCGRVVDSTEFCDQTRVPLPACAWIYPCATHPNDESCFLSRAADNSTPPVMPDAALCGLLRNAGWGPQNLPVVGPIGGNIDTGTSCGGGIPKIFVHSVADWLWAQYTWFSAVVAVVMVTEIFAFLASWALLRRTVETYKPARVKDQLRPFEG